MAAVAKCLGAVQEIVAVDGLQRLKLIVEAAHINDAPGHQVLAEEIERDILVPRRADLLVNLECLIAVLDEREMIVAVIDKVVIDRGGADLLVVAQDNRPRRIGSDDVAPFDAAA